MIAEAWDPIEVERGWRDALAILGELVPTVDEVAESFQSEVFVANVTNDDARLEALAADAIDAAHQGREIAAIFEDFAVAVTYQDALLARALISTLRSIARREMSLSAWKGGD